MASGSANFNLILSDNKFETLLTASSVLNREISNRATLGDLKKTHDVHLTRSYKPFVNIASEYIRYKSMGGNTVINLGTSVWKFELNAKGQFISDMVLEAKFPDIGTGNDVSYADPYYRYCAYPGMRFIVRAAIKSKNIEFASYTRDDAIMMNKFYLDEEHKRGFERCNGQQELKESQYFMGKYTGILHYKDGWQTPSTKQLGATIFIPLEFDFCKDIRNALVSQIIQEKGERNFVEIETAPLEEMIQALRPHETSPNSEELVPVALNHISSLKISLSLLVNNLFVNQDISDIISRDVTFSLFRTKIRQIHQITNGSDSVLLNSLKFPVEYLMVGARSINYHMRYNMDQWHLMGYPQFLFNPSKLFATYTKWNSDLGAVELYPTVCRKITAIGQVLDSIGIEVMGLDIYPMTGSLFYNSYLPMRYRNQTEIRTPDDKNAFLIPFCQYPGKSEASGYFNMSLAREVYLKYTTESSIEDRIRTLGVRFELVISASVLNFLIQRDGHYMLKYT